MSRQKYDRTTHWLIRHRSRDILTVGGLTGVRVSKPAKAELVQPLKLPDGLLEVYRANERKPSYVLLEVATYPEKRVLQQALDDLALAHVHLKVLPDLLIVVLYPKGRFRLSPAHTVKGPLGWSELSGTWKLVELWTLRAEETLATDFVGGFPWVPLMQFDGPPEQLLRRCRQRIEELAPASEQETLLAASQVFASLRFPDPNLLTLLGGKRVMKELPLIQELINEDRQENILFVLRERFGELPEDLVKAVGKIRREKKLRELILWAGTSPTLQKFRDHL